MMQRRMREFLYNGEWRIENGECVIFVLNPSNSTGLENKFYGKIAIQQMSVLQEVESIKLLK